MQEQAQAGRYQAHASPLIWSSWPYLAVRLVLAAVFVYAGFTKLADPEAFATVIGGYGLLPRPLVPWTALALPALEVLAGLGLAFDVRGSLAAVGGMCLLFLAVLGYGMALGLDVDCGCYGPGDPEGQAYGGLRKAFVRDLFLMAGVAYAYVWRAKRKPGLRRLFRAGFQSNTNRQGEVRS
jgi:uncharacterized membrane protein YphA (DoxX/SURF4 family)